MLRNNEWDYSREFISVSPVLDEERRDAFLQALQSLQDEQLEQETKAREEKQQQDEALQKELEEGRRLRAENESRERKRVEQERAKREGSEVDYGIEKTPSTSSGSSKPRRPRTGSSAVSKSRPAPGKKPTGPLTLTARASMILSNLRQVLAQLSGQLTTNPMFLMRFIAFIVGLVAMFGNQRIRERITRVLGTGWTKIKATAGMGVKVSYV